MGFTRPASSSAKLKPKKKIGPFFQKENAPEKTRNKKKMEFPTSIIHPKKPKKNENSQKEHPKKSKKKENSQLHPKKNDWSRGIEYRIIILKLHKTIIFIFRLEKGMLLPL